MKYLVVRTSELETQFVHGPYDTKMEAQNSACVHARDTGTKTKYMIVAMIEKSGEIERTVTANISWVEC